jgi:RNA polymerase sigma factor (sigma-70 family)
MTDGPSSPLARFLCQVADPGWATGLSDGDLLERFRAHHDDLAFAALVRRHGAAVLSVCRGVLHHAQDTEDAFQATFLVLVRRCGSIRKRQSVGSWLYGVAYRVAVRARADRARRRAVEGQVLPRPGADELHEAEDSDLRAVLDEEVRRLPERCRLPFILCYLEGKTNAEAAGLLGCPKGTVLSRLAHARGLLRTRLARRGIGLAAALAAGHGITSAAVPASLVRATARAAGLLARHGPTTADIAAPVRALSEGMVRSMRMTRLKTMAALIVTVGLLGGGLGVLAVRAPGASQGSRQAAAEGPGAAERAAPPPAPEKVRRREAEPNRAGALDRARAAVKTLEEDIQKREEQWADELVKAQLAVLNADEDLQQLERRFALEREREREDIKPVEQELRRIKSRIAPPLSKQEQEGVRALEERHQMLDDRWTERERVRGRVTVQARRELFLAEAHARLLERQQAGQRARAQDILRAADERLRQLEIRHLRPERAGPAETDLERKLDQVLQELNEIRRALRRRPADGDRIDSDRRPPEEP